jgi:hypothetical protein
MPGEVVDRGFSRPLADNPAGTATWLDPDGPGLRGDMLRKQSAEEYSSRVQQPWCIQGDADGRIGTSDLLEQLVRRRLPVATDQKVGGSSPSERAQVKGRLPLSNRPLVCPRTATGRDRGGDYPMSGWPGTTGPGLSSSAWPPSSWSAPERRSSTASSSNGPARMPSRKPPKTRSTGLDNCSLASVHSGIYLRERMTDRGLPRSLTCEAGYPWVTLRDYPFAGVNEAR